MLASPLILVVEDEPIISMYIEDALTSRGYALGGSFDTCRDALLWLSSANPDVAILDTQLKDGSCRHSPLSWNGGTLSSCYRRAQPIKPPWRPCEQPLGSR